MFSPRTKWGRNVVIEITFFSFSIENFSKCVVDAYFTCARTISAAHFLCYLRFLKKRNKAGLSRT